VPAEHLGSLEAQSLTDRHDNNNASTIFIDCNQLRAQRREEGRVA
jgi:hypothetical protein